MTGWPPFVGMKRGGRMVLLGGPLWVSTAQLGFTAWGPIYSFEGRYLVLLKRGQDHMFSDSNSNVPFSGVSQNITPQKVTITPITGGGDINPLPLSLLRATRYGVPLYWCRPQASPHRQGIVVTHKGTLLRGSTNLFQSGRLPAFIE